MSETWQYPVAVPEVGDSYIRELVTRDAEEGPRPKAADTPFRASGAHRCSRSLVYAAAGFEPDTPTDEASLAVMDLGSLVHEQLQGAIGRRYPDAIFEPEMTIGGLVSGHADVFIPSRSEVIEIKTVGRYAMEEAIGVGHPRPGRASDRVTPVGPKLAHVTQAGLYAKGLGAEWVRIVYLSKEAFSYTIAERLGLSTLDRVMAEWLIPEDAWGPLVDAELTRLDGLVDYVNADAVPRREGVDDHGNFVALDPEAQARAAAYRPSWACRGYCAYRERCIDDGPGVVTPVAVEGISGH